MDSRKIQIGLRLPKNLHDLLRRDADMKSQSLNAVMVERLQRSFLMDDVMEWLDNYTGRGSGLANK